MLRRRRHTKKLLRVARMLRDLDAVVAEDRRAPRGPASRVALGRV
jgi:hypothetical protein